MGRFPDPDPFGGIDGSFLSTADPVRTNLDRQQGVGSDENNLNKTGCNV